MRATLVMVVAAVTVLSGCAGGALLDHRTPEQQAWDRATPAERYSMRWEGKPEDDVLFHYGKPTDIIDLSSGNRIYAFHWEAQTGGSRALALGNSAGARSWSGTDFCDRRFEISTATKVVLRVSISGNACDYK